MSKESFSAPTNEAQAPQERSGMSYIDYLEQGGEYGQLRRERFEEDADSTKDNPGKNPHERSGLSYKDYLEQGGEYGQLSRERFDGDATLDGATAKPSMRPNALKSAQELALERVASGEDGQIETMAMQANREITEEAEFQKAQIVAEAAGESLSREEYQRRAKEQFDVIAGSANAGPASGEVDTSDDEALNTPASGEVLVDSDAPARLTRLERIKLGPLVALQNAWAHSRLKERLDQLNSNDNEDKNRNYRQWIAAASIGAVALAAAERLGLSEMINDGLVDLSDVELVADQGAEETRDLEDSPAAFDGESDPDIEPEDTPEDADPVDPETPDGPAGFDSGAEGNENDVSAVEQEGEGYTYEVQQGDGVWNSAEATLIENGIEDPTDSQIWNATQEILPDLREAGELMPGTDDWIAYEDGSKEIEYTQEQVDRMLTSAQ